MRSRAAWGLIVCSVHASALVAACSASPGGVYLIPDDDVADDDVPDASVSEPDATQVEDAAPGRDADATVAPTPDATPDAQPDAAEPDGSFVDADRDADASPEIEAGTDAADAADAAVVEPPPPMTLLRLEGRWDRSLPDTPRVAYPGARITMRFQGTGVVLRLREKKSFRSFEGTSQFSVSVDGAPPTTLVTAVAAGQEETRDYLVAQGLPQGVHTAQLVRRTEAEFGSTRIMDVTVLDGQMLAPPPRPLHRIEFVGDSNMTGYGVEVTRPMVEGDPPCSHTPQNQNYEKAFPFLITTRFGAEAESPVHSGKGVYYNQTRTDSVTLPVLYQRSVPSERDAVYDPSTFAAEAVVVLVGGNDFAEQAQDDFPTVAEVQTAYDGLIGQIRTAHPDAVVFATLSAGVSDFSPAGVMVRTKLRTIITDVLRARTEAGDTRLVFHELPQAGGAELSACHYHPGPALHASLALSLGDVMAARLGW